MADNLNRFIEAQESSYGTALSEIRSGRKRSHWMWYIFPQLKGLGRSDTSQFYGIENKEEAIAYLNHPVLGRRLEEITTTLLELEERNPTAIFGRPDNLKLRSCMTLFDLVAKEVGQSENNYARVLDQFFGGKRDKGTLQMIED